MDNLHKAILDSNIKNKTKDQLLKLFKTGYGLYFSRGETKTKDCILRYEQSVGEGDYGHSAIEGDNLGVLKALSTPFSKSFVDFIYIDPPYNTKTKLTYEDNRVHSSWLEMMEERLRVAKDLLNDDGIITISIDDNEVFALKLLMDQIFGETNFIHNIIWRKKSGGGQDAKFLANEHEYVLVYAKNKNKAQANTISVKRNIKEFNQVINGKHAQLMKLEKWGIGARKQDAPSLHYSIKDPFGKEFFPMAPDGTPGRWRKKPENLSKDKIIWKESKGRLCPYEVRYYEDFKIKKVVNRSIFYDIAENTSGTKEVTKVFGKKGVFDYPKPTGLLMHLINNFVKKDNAIILDFFAGSGTTLHAVAKYNKKHKTNHRTIIVNRNETKRDIFDEVTLERTKHVAKEFNQKIYIFRAEEQIYEFLEEYENDLSKNLDPHIMLGMGAERLDENVFSKDGISWVYVKLCSPDEAHIKIKSILNDNKILSGDSLNILLTDMQELKNKTLDMISKLEANIERVPSSIISYESKVKNG